MACRELNALVESQEDPRLCSHFRSIQKNSIRREIEHTSLHGILPGEGSHRLCSREKVTGCCGALSCSIIGVKTRHRAAPAHEVFFVYFFFSRCGGPVAGGDGN